MNCFRPIAFAASLSGPAQFRLPAGNVQSFGDGNILAIGGWIIAVGISSSVYIAVQPRPEPVFPSPLLEQTVGFLVGRGADVFRMDIRFPLTWYRNGSVEATVRFWVEHFLSCGRERRLFLAFPPRLIRNILLPLSSAAETAIRFWEEVHTLMNALSSEFPGTLLRMRIPLWKLARDWETQWNSALEIAERHGAMSADLRVLIDSANRAWAIVVSEHLEPVHYVMKPETIARLL